MRLPLWDWQFLVATAAMLLCAGGLLRALARASARRGPGCAGCPRRPRGRGRVVLTVQGRRV